MGRLGRGRGGPGGGENGCDLYLWLGLGCLGCLGKMLLEVEWVLMCSVQVEVGTRCTNEFVGVGCEG